MIGSESFIVTALIRAIIPCEGLVRKKKRGRDLMAKSTYVGFVCICNLVRS